MSAPCVQNISREQAFRLAGVYSFCGTILMVVFVAWLSGQFAAVLSNLGDFFSGMALQQRDTGSVGEFVSFLPSLLVVDLVVSFGSLLIVSLFIPSGVNTEKHRVVEMLNRLAIQPMSYSRFVFKICLEELGGRWLFLTLLPMLLFSPSSTFYYTMVVVGSLAFAAIHVFNYPHRNRDTWAMVIPQFLGAFPLAYVYTKFGLGAAIVFHLATDMILFSVHKNKGPHPKVFAALFFDSVVIVICLFAGAHWDEIATIFDPAQGYLSRASVVQALTALLFVEVAVATILTALFYDAGKASELSKRNRCLTLAEFLCGVPFAAVLFWLVANVLSALFSFCSIPPTDSVLILAVLSVLGWQCCSGSSLASTFWANLTETFLLVSIAVFMPWASAFCVIALFVCFKVLRKVVIGDMTLHLRESPL